MEELQLPLYRAAFVKSEDGTGLDLMAMVKTPAIMKTYVKFSEQANVKFQIQDKEQGIVFAPALIPDMPIYRETKELGKFYMYFTAEDIQNVVLDWIASGKINSFNIEHDKQTSGILPLNIFVTNPNTVKTVVGFEDMPMGTFFLGAKVVNPAVTKMIEEGLINGWSIQGNFDLHPIQMVDVAVAEAVIDHLIN